MPIAVAGVGDRVHIGAMSRSVRMWLMIMPLALQAAVASCGAAPLLINAQQADYRTRPEYVRDHFAHIETLPFDGLAITTATGSALMNGAARSYVEMSGDFAPLNGLVFTRMRHNFAVVNVDRPADFFGDWSVTVENFRLLAKVLKEKGVAGIFFDNEPYQDSLFNYPEDCSDPSKSLDQYREQARLRGKQIAKAIAGEYPEIVVMALHGPYSSFSGTPDQVRGGQTNWTLEELRGPFSAGLIEGLDSRAKFIDGGEVYAYRTVADFQLSYDYRKTSIASATENCPFISNYLRPVWPLKISISFGLYNFMFAGQPMDPSIMRTTLERALRRCDDYVWLYCEEVNWNAPGEIPQPLMDAVVGARAAVQNPPANAAPSVSIISPATDLRFTTPGSITITATASDADGSVSKVEFFSGATKLGETMSPPFSFAWSNPAAGTYALTAKATDNSGATTTSSAVTVIIGAAFAANINFQPAEGSPAVGYFSDTGETYGARGNGLTYGWNFSHTGDMRNRRDSNDRRLATLCQMRSGGIWQIAVPNGTYEVTVGIGDGSYPSTYTANVEGVNYWTGQSLNAGQFVNQTHAVIVTDGQLTIDPGNAADEATRLDYVLIAAASAPPAAPSGLWASASSADTITLRWADNSSNETAFTLQRSTSADFTTALQTLSFAPNVSSYTDSGLNPVTTYYYRLRSTNAAGQSAFSNTPAPTTPILPNTNPPAGNPPPQISQVVATRAADSTTTFSLFFPTLADRNYVVDFTDSLEGGIWTLVPGSAHLGDGTLQSVTDTSSATARFFRLRAWP